MKLNSLKLEVTPEYEKRRAKMIEQKREYRKKYPEKILLASAKRRAKIENKEFNIELEDVKIPQFCPILNIRIQTGPLSNSSPSIDRIDSSRGYIKGNVKVISYLANTMKSNATEEQLLTFAANIKKYLENK